MNNPHDPMGAYENWRRKEVAKTRAWAAIAWLVVIASAVLAVGLLWIVVTLLIIFFG